jgi:hypothetical protein
MKKLVISLLTLCSSAHLMSQNIDWSTPPDALSTTSVNSSDPNVAIDTAGNVAAVWVDNNLVKVRTKPVSGSWSTATTLSGSGGSSPRVVLDGSGNGTAIWLEGGIVKASSKPAAGSWSSATNLSQSGASSPDLATDTAGNAVAVWVRSGDVEASTKLVGGSWARVTINSTSAAAPRVALGGTGSAARAVVVWHGVASSTNVIYASTRLLSGSWSAAQALSNTTINAAYADVDVDANANATAIWYQYAVAGANYSNVVLQSAERPANGNWSTAVTISPPGIRNPANLMARVAYDGNGNAMALWNTSYDDETLNVLSSVKSARGCWTAPVAVGNSNIYAFQQDLSTASFGDAVATIMFYNGSSLMIQSLEYDTATAPSTLWSVPLNISLGDNNGNPKIATSITGNVMHAASVWLNYDGSNTLVHASTGAKTLVSPPSALSVTQSNNNHGIFTEYYNTFSWTASTDSDVIGYLVYRNGVLIDQVAASVTSIVDDNRVQSGALTYGVSAINSDGLRSKIVYVNYP